MFFPISTHSTATPGIPPASTVLKPDSLEGSAAVEPQRFTPDLSGHLRALYAVIPDNARTLCITAAAGTELAGASFGGTVRASSLPTVVYNPKTFIPHAASLRQPFGHCARFPTAASRRSLGRVSVPMWLIILSDQLPVVALVSRYLTN